MSISWTNTSPIVRVLACACLRGYQRARDAGGEELLVGRRPLLGADELPPACAFVFAEPALVARGEDLPETRAEEGQIVRRKVGDGPERQENIAQQRAGIAGARGKSAGAMKCRLPVLRNANARRRHEMIGNLAPIERRYAAA